MFKLTGLAAALLALATAAHAQTTFTVALRPLADEKAVFATVESRNVVPARARIGGTVVELTAHYGDEVKEGQQLAVVGDQKLQLQIHALDAQIQGLRAQLAEGQVDFRRAESLARSGAGSRQALDQARTALDVASSSLAARIAERDVVVQQMREGAVLAPRDGRVLQVPVTQGTVVMAGDTIARVAEANYVLRLSVPERHAKFIHVNDKVRLDGADLGTEGPVFGTVELVYPQIQDGRVIADATAPGIGHYFVGQRIRVWVNAGDRPGYVIPEHLIHSRFGLSYVNRRASDGTVIEIPVQRGRDMPTPQMPDGVEILSGLQNGDVLVAP
ncbi:efflux RND transporter periplasmic adaptor subunit [Rhodopila globiformis]|uniref:Efflux transporter periplasmic adaptor subunit n=1 Tax=Rhodopila globiformis TaxID=1071 RepID=A0A2S6MZF5_RHOGL|nr:efflux RND transporter periplasmic adaptor subunit [Rhodopila globiformis]PPQ27730.1 efflux transporter periplasmic adaptor subunit [Rhodopila globiformis]